MIVVVLRTGVKVSAMHATELIKNSTHVISPIGNEEFGEE